MQSPHPFNTRGQVDGPFSSQHNNNAIREPSDNNHPPSGRASAPHQTTGQQTPVGQPERLFKYIEVYGNKFALQVKESSTQQKGQKEPWSTLMFESAKRNNPNSAADRTYNWQRGAKISFQLTLNELPLFIAVLFGMVGDVEFANHGHDNSKKLDIKFQGDKFFVTMLGGGVQGAYGVPIQLTDALNIGNFALSQYIKNFDGLDPQSALNNIKKYVELMLKNNKFPRSKFRG